MFVGKYERQLDPKGRLALPSDFRPRFEPRCYLAYGQDGCIEVMTPEAYVHLEHLNDRLHDGLGAIIEKHGFPAHVIGLGAKGCIVFSPEPVLNYRDWAHKTNGPLNELAWLYNMNRGVFMTPGREEEWTLSVQHDDADIDRFIDVFAELAADLTS